MNVAAHRLSPQRLDDAIRAAGIPSDSELARRVGVARVQPGQWRRGQTTPAGDTLASLCRVLGVSPAYLFGEEDLDDLGVMLSRLSREQRERVRAYVQGLLDSAAAGASGPPARNTK